jgi:ATP-dependent Lon protease
MIIKTKLSVVFFFLKGVVTGLAYTEYGGSLIYIEAMQSSYYKSSQGSGGASLVFR